MDQVTRKEFIDLVARQDKADANQREMSKDIKQIRLDTHKLVEMYRTLSGGTQLLLSIGKLAAAFTAFATAIVVFKNWWFK